MQDENFEFELKLPKSYLYFDLAVLGSSIAVAILYSVMFSVGKVSKVIFGLIVGFTCFFSIISIIGIYMITSEKFSLKDGVFRYTLPFKRAQSVSVKDVAKVDVCKSKRKNMNDILFLSEDGKVLMQLTDGGMALEQNKLALALDHYKIPFNQD